MFRAYSVYILVQPLKSGYSAMSKFCGNLGMVQFGSLFDHGYSNISCQADNEVWTSFV